MVRVSIILALAAITGPPAAAGPGDPLAQRRAQCVDWMMSAYPSGLAEVACIDEFSLPSPFVFQCISAQHNGFESKTQRRACELFFARASKAANGGYVLN